MGHRRAGVSSVLVEHLLYKHRGEHEYPAARFVVTFAGKGLQCTWGALRGAVAPSGCWGLSPGAGPNFTGCCSSRCSQAPRGDCCISVAGALKPAKPLVHKAESPKSFPPKLGAVSRRLPGSPEEFSELFGDEAAACVLSLSKTMLQVKLSCVLALVVLLVFF